MVGWMRSLNRCNFSYRVLGLKEEWCGWKWRAHKYLEALHQLPHNAIVILCDAYDAMAVRDSAGVCCRMCLMLSL